jgi:ZIP family zinc transporter
MVYKRSMSQQLGLILPHILLATGAGLAGGLVHVLSPRPGRARSNISLQAVLAVVTLASIIPAVERMGNVGILRLGSRGVMIVLKWLQSFEREERSKHKPPAGLVTAAAVDTFLDGVIIGASFFAGQQLGTLLAIALAIELFFLTLSVGVEFRKSRSKPWQGLAVTSGIACLQLVGALGASLFLAGASEATLAVVLAFGAAALIYLIAEELLVETIQAEESIFQRRCCLLISFTGVEAFG